MKSEAQIRERLSWLRAALADTDRTGIGIREVYLTAISELLWVLDENPEPQVRTSVPGPASVY